MNTDVKEIVDLCTPNMDIIEIVDDHPVEKKCEAVVIKSTINFERISNLDQRLSILPLYPTSDIQNQEKYPLLPNMSRIYLYAKKSIVRCNIFSSSLSIDGYRIGSSIFRCV